MVKRYVMTEYPHECYMEQDDAGEYVLHDDYTALQAENDRLKVEVLDLCVAIADAYYETGEYKSVVGAALDIQTALIDAHKGE